ncbi:hypothetical protein [Arthrobacter sp.]|uniref:hypothetical protein n=1 Tax=Arthrobacter sp. TaxID=1667 RepID=UPI0026E111C6|nr:hypothetical protein [Arthrobacter sp.]MDO5752290.1 hypothetical protein [Arthrobacter sp.]
MAALNVLVAPKGQLGGLREILTDWSGLGLVDGFVWVEPEMVTETGIGGVEVVGGRQRGVNLHSLAAEAGNYDRLRVAVLVTAGADAPQVSTETGQRVALFLESSFGGRPVTRVRAVAARVNDIETVQDLAHEGWHNIVFAPEESAGVNQGHSLLHATADPFALGRHAAVACAGILAMWRGMGASVLDDQMLLPGQNARLMRAFYRNLDATAVEEELRAQVTDVSQRLPLPSRMGSAAIYIEDVSLASRTMAEQLWTKHAQVLQGPREQKQASVSKPIGAWTALGMMFSFICAALKNVPRNWVNRIGVKIKSTAAAAIHSVVFGAAPAQYTVIVDGIAPDGMPASWLDVREAAVELDKVLENAGMPREHEVHADLSSLWQDYAAGALTLSDAGERVAALPPVQIGTQRAVVRTPRSAVPLAAERFAGIPAHLSSSMSLGPVSPYDVMGIYNAEQRLQKTAADPNLGVPASGALAALRTWKQSFADSYANHVGSRIAQHLLSTTQELQGVLRQIRDAADASDSLAPVHQAQKKIALWMKIIMGIAIAAVVVTVVLLASEVIEVGPGIAVLAGILIAWLVVALIVFMRGQRELFRLINARTAMLEQDEINRRNLRHILRDLRRLGDAYSQFLAWSHVVGSVLHEPFGRNVSQAAAKEVYVQGLPLNVKVGSVAINPQNIGMATAQLRQGIFSTGWLSQPWQTAVNGAPAQLGSRGYELSGNVELLFRQLGDGETSLLPLWIAALDEQGINNAASHDVWNHVLAELQNNRADLAATMTSTVNEVRDGSVAQTSLDAFMSGTTPADATMPGQFDGEVLTDLGRNAGKGRVELSIPFHVRHGMSQWAGLVQLSQGIGAHEFKAFKSAPVEPNWWDNAESMPAVPTVDIAVPEGPTF